jgi:acyl carrier protein
MEKGLVDSMGILRLITFVEEKYAVPVRDEDLVTDNWDSVQRITTFVKNRLQASTQ